MEELELEQVPVERCSLARVAKVLGDKWALLVLRQVLYGRRRFDEIVKDLGLSRSVLTDRLKQLVELGVLRRVPYRADGERVRHSYRLTRAGVELLPALVGLMQGGDRHLGDSEEPPLALFHADCGARISAKLVCDDGHAAEDFHRIVSKRSE